MTGVSDRRKAESVLGGRGATVIDATMLPRVRPDGHLKLPHLWPGKLPRAGQRDCRSFAASRIERGGEGRNLVELSRFRRAEMK